MARTLFVISDVHGHCTLLRNALRDVGFDPTDSEHLLVGCGDYFDRGNENAEVLRYLDRIPNKVLLRGNHEDMLLRLLYTGQVLPHHYINGTLRTLENFFGRRVIDPVDDTLDFSGHTRTVDRLCDFIGQMVDYYETDGYVFVHGWLPTGDRATASSDDWERARISRWTEQYNGERPLADKTLVCGHMPTFYATRFDPDRPAACGDVFYGNGLVAIDAGTCDSQQINVLVLKGE